jgi:hypothetical protein
MPRLVVTISKKMDRALRAHSEETNAPVAAIVREAIEEWAQRRGMDVRDEITWGGPRKVEDDEGQPVAVGAR